jgi:hypothetical protein
MIINEAIKAVPHKSMRLQMALSKLRYVYRAHNMTSDGVSHYEQRLSKLCYSRCEMTNGERTYTAGYITTLYHLCEL